MTYTNRNKPGFLSLPLGYVAPAAITGTTVNLSSYSPDATGATSSSTAMTAAMNAAGVGGKIVIGAGTFKFTTPIIPKAGQTFEGAGIDVTIMQIMTSALANSYNSGTDTITAGAFASLGLFQGIAVTGNGQTANPGVTVSNLTVNGGRYGALWTSRGITDWNAAHPSETVDAGDVGTLVPNRHYDSITCPDGNGQGVALKWGWTVDTVRFTNINGFKVGAFGAHGSVIRNCIWDNAGNNSEGSAAGEKDQIGGGGGVHNLLIEDCFIGPDCVGSGIDITQGQLVTIRRSQIHAFSLILEGVQDFTIEDCYVGPLGGYGGTGGGGSINIKPNTQYRSSYAGDYAGNSYANPGNPATTLPGAGGFQPRGGRIINNAVVECVGGAGINLIYSDNYKLGASNALNTGNATDPFFVAALAADPDSHGFPFYAPGGNNVIEGNSLLYCERMGINIAGSSADSKSTPDIMRRNTIVNVVPLLTGGGAQTTFTPGVGTWQSGCIGTNIGIGDVIADNYFRDTRAGLYDINGVQIGASYSPTTVVDWVVSNTWVANNVNDGLTGVDLYEP